VAAPDEKSAPPERDVRVQVRADTDAILGRLLSRVRTLEDRAVQRWGGAPYRRAQQAYAAGDTAYLENNFDLANEKYQEAFDALEPLVGQVDRIFNTTLADAEQALLNGDTADALRLYDLAVAISPSHGPARAGLVRAQNLDEVLSLTEQGLSHERNLELDAAAQSFERALELDPDWEVAKNGLQRVKGTVNDLEFDQRMTEGLTALAENNFLAARAAFRMAQELQPGSPEPADGLLQVDQGLRLGNIAALEREAGRLERAERWRESAESYERLLELDGNLSFAQDGLSRSRQRIALHKQLDDYIANPDSLSANRTMQTATKLVVDITRMPEIGPRLTEQRDELSRLLKRAATPLTVELVSDNVTDVSIYKIGKLGNFNATELSLRPGTYVAVGSRPGYRDVRLEFRVAPEENMQPVIVRCEERI
jgi:tetratricopeptide (TPR) repeat protein